VVNSERERPLGVVLFGAGRGKLGQSSGAIEQVRIDEIVESTGVCLRAPGCV
jgi:hypothetical protein